MTGDMTETIGASGHTLEQLAAYEERGRTPAIPEIDGDPECRAVLDSMSRLGALSRELVEHDAPREVPESWFQQILGEVARESRAGRDLPVVDAAPVRVVVTEGAVRGLVREAGDAVAGVLVERVQVELEADAATGTGGRLEVRLTISALYGTRLVTVADDVRARVRRALEEHTDWAVGAIDVVVDSVRPTEEER